MGFYSSQSPVADARRLGVHIREPEINASLAHATLEPGPAGTGGVALCLGLANGHRDVLAVDRRHRLAQHPQHPLALPLPQLARVRPTARQREVHHRAQAVHVVRLVEHFRARRLGRAELDGVQRITGEHVPQHQATVDQDRLARSAEQHVVRAHTAVDDARLVHAGQRRRQRPAQDDRVRRGQRTAAGDQLGQRLRALLTPQHLTAVRAGLDRVDRQHRRDVPHRRLLAVEHRLRALVEKGSMTSEARRSS